MSFVISTSAKAGVVWSSGVVVVGATIVVVVVGFVAADLESDEHAASSASTATATAMRLMP
jgi:hypothetical protein